MHFLEWRKKYGIFAMLFNFQGGEKVEIIFTLNPHYENSQLSVAGKLSFSN